LFQLLDLPKVVTQTKTFLAFARGIRNPTRQIVQTAKKDNDNNYKGKLETGTPKIYFSNSKYFISS